MIRHTILFKVKPYTTNESIQNAISEIVALKDKLQGILYITAGECQFHDEKSTQFFIQGISHAISIDFKDQDALNRFFNDPVTHPAKNSIVTISDGGYAGIIGFEFVNNEIF